MCLGFGGFIIGSSRFAFQARQLLPNRTLLVFSAMFVAMALFGIGSQIWFRRRMISDFTYDAQALRYRTLGIAEMQMRTLWDIAKVRTWRGRGGALGYVLRFRDKHKLYLEFSVSNSGR